MTPKWHIILGAVFTFVFWIVFHETSPIFLALIFLASFLIDFDHYLNFVFKKNSFSLKSALKHFHEIKEKEEKEPFKPSESKSHFFVFHALEFHLIVAALGLLWQGFFFVLIGMTFHSLTDIIYLKKHKLLYKREFFLIRQVFKNFK